MPTPRLTIYFDLDGTLLDVSGRYYAVYSRLVSQMGGKPLSQEDYWRLRRLNAAPKEFLPGLDSIGREVFAQSWLAAIESPTVLGLDGLLPGIRETLRDLSQKHRLVLVTLRRSRERLLEQLHTLVLDVFFAKVLTTAEAGAAGEVKGRLIKRDGADPKTAIVVGDSEADVQAARLAGLPAVCVCSGIRDRRFLAELAPDSIIESITELPALLSSEALLATPGSAA